MDNLDYGTIGIAVVAAFKLIFHSPRISKFLKK